MHIETYLSITILFIYYSYKLIFLSELHFFRIADLTPRTLMMCIYDTNRVQREYIFYKKYRALCHNETFDLVSIVVLEYDEGWHLYIKAF